MICSSCPRCHKDLPFTLQEVPCDKDWKALQQKWEQPEKMEASYTAGSIRAISQLLNPSVCSCWSTPWKVRGKQTLSEPSEAILQIRHCPAFPARGPPNGSGGIYCPSSAQLSGEDLATEAVRVMRGQSPPRRTKLCRPAAAGTLRVGAFLKSVTSPLLKWDLDSKAHRKQCAALGWGKKSNSKTYLLFFHLNVFMPFSQFPGEAPMDTSASLCHSGFWIKSRRSPKPQFPRTPLRSEAATEGGCFPASNSSTPSPPASLGTPTGFTFSWRLLNSAVGPCMILSLLL